MIQAYVLIFSGNLNFEKCSPNLLLLRKSSDESMPNIDCFPQRHCEGIRPSTEGEGGEGVGPERTHRRKLAQDLGARNRK